MRLFKHIYRGPAGAEDALQWMSKDEGIAGADQEGLMGLSVVIRFRPARLDS